MKPNRCQATTKDGKLCSAQPLASGLCRWHDPAFVGERREWSRKGGAGRSNANRARKRLPKTLVDVQDILLRALHALEAGELEPQRATAMSAVARAVVTVHEHGTLEARLSALEAAAGIGEGKRA